MESFQILTPWSRPGSCRQDPLIYRHLDPGNCPPRCAVTWRVCNFLLHDHTNNRVQWVFPFSHKMVKIRKFANFRISFSLVVGFPPILIFSGSSFGPYSLRFLPWKVGQNKPKTALGHPAGQNNAFLVFYRPCTREIRLTTSPEPFHSATHCWDSHFFCFGRA